MKEVKDTTAPSRLTSDESVSCDDELSLLCPAADLARFSVLLTLFAGDVDLWLAQIGPEIPVAGEALGDLLFLCRVKAAANRNPEFLNRTFRLVTDLEGLMSELDAQDIN